MPNLKQIAITSALVVTLTGCNIFGPSVEEEIYTSFEAAVKLENNFSEQTETLGTLEEREQVVYNQITELSAEDIEPLHQLADDAIALAKERSKKIEEEREYFLAAEKEFAKATSKISELKDQNLKSEATNVSNLMVDRYNMYDEIHSKYNEAIKNDIELYELLKSEDITMEVFQEKAEKSNEIYTTVTELNKEFNEKTTKFNKSKEAFHKAAGFAKEN